MLESRGGKPKGTIMSEPTTMQDRRKELETLLRQFKDHPERDWSKERERASVLSKMLAEHDRAQG